MVGHIYIYIDMYISRLSVSSGAGDVREFLLLLLLLLLLLSVVLIIILIIIILIIIYCFFGVSEFYFSLVW